MGGACNTFDHQKIFLRHQRPVRLESGKPHHVQREWEGDTYEDKGTILAVEPGALLKYNYWSSMSGIADKPENYVDITDEVREHNGKTMITISQENIPTEKLKHHAVENWTQVLKNLKELLEDEN